MESVYKCILSPFLKNLRTCQIGRGAAACDPLKEIACWDVCPMDTRNREEVLYFVIDGGKILFRSRDRGVALAYLHGWRGAAVMLVRARRLRNLCPACQ